MANIEFDPKRRPESVNPALEGVDNHVKRNLLGASLGKVNQGPDQVNVLDSVRSAKGLIPQTESKRRVVVLPTAPKVDGGESSPTKPQIRRDMERHGTTFSQQTIHELSMLHAARAAAKNVEVSAQKREERAQEAEHDEQRDDARRRLREDENRIREGYRQGALRETS